MPENPSLYVCPALNSLAIRYQPSSIPTFQTVKDQWQALAVVFPNLQSLDIQIVLRKLCIPVVNGIRQPELEVIVQLNAIKRLIRELSWTLFPKLCHFNDKKTFEHFGRHQNYHQEYFHNYYL